MRVCSCVRLCVCVCMCAGVLACARAFMCGSRAEPAEAGALVERLTAAYKLGMRAVPVDAAAEDVYGPLPFVIGCVGMFMLRVGCACVSVRVCMYA